jgi:hypothetical protein
VYILMQWFVLIAPTNVLALEQLQLDVAIPFLKPAAQGNRVDFWQQRPIEAILRAICVQTSALGVAVQEELRVQVVVIRACTLKRMACASRDVPTITTLKPQPKSAILALLHALYLMECLVLALVPATAMPVPPTDPFSTNALKHVATTKLC